MNGAKFVALLVLTSLYQDCAQASAPQDNFACYGTGLCSRIPLQCNDTSNVFILRAEYGHQPMWTQCPDGALTSCDNTTCCYPANETCYQHYDLKDFEALYNECWGKRCSYFSAEWTDQLCSNMFFRHSGYARIQHACLTESEMTSFYSTSTVVGPAIAVRHDASVQNDVTTLHCQVDTTDCVQNTVDVLLVREQGGSDEKQRDFNSIKAGEHSIPSGNDFQYLQFNATTPFVVSVDVGHSTRQDAWAVIREMNGREMQMKCGFTGKILPHGSMCGDESSVNVGAVVGTVVIVMAVVTLVAVGGVYFIRRRKGQREDQGSKGRPRVDRAAVHTVPNAADLDNSTRRPAHNVQDGVSNTGGSASLPVAEVKGRSLGSTVNASEADPDYDKIGEVLKSQNGNAAASGIHGNPKSPVEDPDYDKLGGNKPQSSPSNPAATYGRLGEVGGGGEDTDYSHDHLARGRHAAPDVIDSDYSTSALNVTSEGDYNVAGIPPKQHVITGSDYDVAQIVTSEGDYNRVDFQAKKQHVVTGSDYDTAEIVTSEGDYNKLDFQGEKQKVLTGSDYDMATAVTSDSI